MADFPIALTGAVDGSTDVLAKHLNNLEEKVGIDGSEDTDSLDYLTKAAADPGHTHTDYSPTSHNHSGVYEPANANLLETSDIGVSIAAYDHSHTGVYAPVLGADDNYVTDAEKTAIGTIGDKAPLANPTFTGAVTLPKAIEIQDTTGDHQYVLAVNELTADRTVTLPLLTGNDEFVFKDHAQVLTNKGVTKRVASTTDDATAIINCETTDDYYLTSIANATEISVTGTATPGQTIFIGLKDAGTSKDITWTGITALGVTLPPVTTANKQHIIGIKYIASAWRAIAVGVEA